MKHTLDFGREREVFRYLGKRLRVESAKACIAKDNVFPVQRETWFTFTLNMLMEFNQYSAIWLGLTLSRIGFWDVRSMPRLVCVIDTLIKISQKHVSSG